MEDGRRIQEHAALQRRGTQASPVRYARSRLAILKHIQSRSFRQANLVVFISQFAKSIIDIVVGPRAGKAVVIPHGVNDRFREPGRANLELKLPDRYVAYVSIVTVYKAQLEVVQAWALMRKARQSTRNCCSSGRATTSTKRESAGSSSNLACRTK